MKIKPGEQFKVFNNIALVSNYGRVYSLISEQFITPIKNNKGYSVFRIQTNRKRKVFFLHITVVNLFGDKNGRRLPQGVINGTESMIALDLNIDHINRDKTNNSVENLELVTHSENMKRFYQKKFQALKADFEELEQIFS